MTELRRVLGIDPGLTATGFGVVDGDARGAATAIAMGTIRTRRQRSRPERLGEIFDGVGELIDQHHPDELAIELQYVAENVRSAMTIGEARAAAMVSLSSVIAPPCGGVRCRRSSVPSRRVRRWPAAPPPCR